MPLLSRICLQMQRAAKMLLHRQLHMAWNAFRDHAWLAVLQRQAMMKWSNKALYEALHALRWATFARLRIVPLMCRTVLGVPGC